MCCAQFIVKYVLIIANIIFALAGLAIIGLGVAVHIQIKDIVELIPVNLSTLSISIIVIGCIVFVISYLACCGAIRESRCMLILYSIFMAILAAFKIYLAVIIFRFLDSAITTVNGWLTTSFANSDLRPAYHAMESLFRCCGTTGSDSYTSINEIIPPTCCQNPINYQCSVPAEIYQGCTTGLSEYFEAFGEAIGAVLIVVIVVEIVCVVFGLFLSSEIRRKRYASA